MHKKLATGAIAALAITSLGGLAVAAANTVSTTPAPASVSRYDDSTKGNEARRRDDPAAHDANDDKGKDDPAVHDANDDNGADDPASHDANDDKGKDDPATHDTGDDSRSHPVPVPTAPRPTVVSPGQRPTTPVTQRPATTNPSTHDAGDDKGGQRGGGSPTPTSVNSGPSSGTKGGSSGPSSGSNHGSGTPTDDKTGSSGTPTDDKGHHGSGHS